MDDDNTNHRSCQQGPEGGIGGNHTSRRELVVREYKNPAGKKIPEWRMKNNTNTGIPRIQPAG